MSSPLHSPRLDVSIIIALLGATVMFGARAAETNNSPPVITVNGRGEVSATPTRAVVRLGAAAQQPDAGAAQKEVNAVVAKAMEKIGALDIPPQRIRTVGLTLTPIYSSAPRNQPEAVPKIVAYRASNVIQVEVDELKKIGPVVDEAIAAGANQLQNISFELQDEGPARREALTQAVRDAREKAQVIARALDGTLGPVREVMEGNVHLVRPQMEMTRGAFAMADAGTPVSPGQISVEASVTIRFELR